MAHKRVRSSRFPGVYWRETTDPQRRHNGRLDRCYDFCIRVNGKLKWVAVGWSSEGYSEQKAANARRQALEAAARGPEHAREQQEKYTLNAAAAAYLTWLEGEGKHVRQERNRYEVHVRDLLGHLPISAVSAPQVDALKSALLKTHSPGSVLRLLSTCRAIVNHAVRMGAWDGVNPFGRTRLTMPRPENKGERFLTPEEARRLLDALEVRSPQLRDMAWLSLKTGLRSTEIFRLTGGDVDAAAGVLWITEKGGRRVAVRVGRDVLDLLQGYGRGAGEYVFPARGGGRMGKISKTFEHVCRELGLNPVDAGERDNRRKVWFHTLRHTFASWLAQSGTVTLYELRDLMRHNSIVMTERYAHLVPAQTQAKAALIGDILAAGDAPLPREDAD